MGVAGWDGTAVAGIGVAVIFCPQATRIQRRAREAMHLRMGKPDFMREAEELEMGEPLELWRWNHRQKILRGPAGPAGIVGSSKIPPGITIRLFRAFCDQENLRIVG